MLKCLDLNMVIFSISGERQGTVPQGVWDFHPRVLQVPGTVLLGGVPLQLNAIRLFHEQIFIPADGMDEFNRHLKELIEEYDDGEVEQAAAGAPDNRHVRIENKNFFFSCKKNAQGRYITVSEIKGNFRNSILIPESGWDDFRDVFDDYVKQCKEHD